MTSQNWLASSSAGRVPNGLGKPHTCQIVVARFSNSESTSTQHVAIDATSTVCPAY